MGLNSEIIAIGSYGASVSDSLEYSHEFYKNTRKGTKIISTCFFVESGSTESRELADCFKIDPWDFNQHKLDPFDVNLTKLENLFGQEDVKKFLLLRTANFEFFFKPNG